LDEHVPGRLLVQRADSASDTDVEQAIAQSGAKTHHKIDQIGVSVLELPEQALDGVSQALIRSGRFTFVERDHLAHASTTPNDPNFASQWHLSTIQAPSAWSITTGSSSVPIAVIDSGADPLHPDLAPKLIPGWNFITGTSNTSDTGCNTGHGTAVSGAAGAATTNHIGVAGVGWSNPIMPLVATSSSCVAMYSDIASAINYAADHGVRIINISIGGSSASSTLQSAVNYAWNKGAVVFAAAGNSSNSTPVYPAACTNAVAVGATVSGDTLASFSNYGSWVDLTAPGDMILTTQMGGSYGYWYGTSLASPIAAAVGALALSANPSLSAAALVSLLEKNTDDLGAPGFDQYFAWGRVNAYKAVTAAKAASSGGDTTTPTVSIPAPTSGATVAATIAVQGTATDNTAITNIELDVDGVATATATSSPFSFSWDSTSKANGSHTLTVKAFDAANNVGSASVTVNVANTAVDTTLPTVLISAPGNGASVSGTVPVQGTASDNVGVTKIELDVDGAAAATVTSSPFSFSWNSASKPNGSHTLTVKAFDAANNVGSTSVTVTVGNAATVADTTPPVVAITQPLAGTRVTRNLTIAVSATDNVGVAHVSIYVDNVQLCNDTQAPYTCSWNPKKYSAGSHTITAKAWDAAGNVGQALPVTVTK
jgi:subtilisin family serine protease